MKLCIPDGDRDYLNFHGLTVVLGDVSFFLTKEKYLCHSTVTLLCFKSWSLYWHQWLDLETLFEIFYFIKMMLQFSFRVHINFRQQFLDETNVGESITITGYQKCQHVGSLMAMILLCC